MFMHQVICNLCQIMLCMDWSFGMMKRQYRTIIGWHSFDIIAASSSVFIFGYFPKTKNRIMKCSWIDNWDGIQLRYFLSIQRSHWLTHILIGNKINMTSLQLVGLHCLWTGNRELKLKTLISDYLLLTFLLNQFLQIVY